MNLSLLDEFNLFSKELQHCLSPLALQEVAKEVGFVKRTRKYRTQELIALCVWLSQKFASTSLTQLCSNLESSTGVLMTPEGLNQRFNPSAVKLLQHIFSSLLIQKLFTSQRFLHRYTNRFQRI